MPIALNTGVNFVAVAQTDPPREAFKTVSEVPCVACGCLCDDIVVQIRGDTLINAENACAIGSKWFAARAEPGSFPDALVGGVAVSADAGVSAAAERLASASNPIILGLSMETMEAQAAAIGLADFLGAVIDVGNSSTAMPRLAAIQRVGCASATLGEVRHRADVVVFWNCDPVATHPRHLERYSVAPPGRFLPRGRADRAVILVADPQRPNSTAALADVVISLAPDAQLEALWTLRALVQGVTIAASDTLGDLACRMLSAKYGAFFTGDALGDSATHEAALLLVRDLNRTSRFVALSLGEPGNAAGAHAVATWQAGAPTPIDFASGRPEFRPGESSAESLLTRGLVDLALIVADEPRDWLSATARRQLDQIPNIVIARDAVQRNAAVALTCSEFGIESAGTIMRCDGVALPLRALRTSPHRDARTWINHIASAVRDRNSES